MVIIETRTFVRVIGRHLTHGFCEERKNGFDKGTVGAARKGSKGGIEMKKQIFDELLGSVRGAGKIRRGESTPARATREEDLDVHKIRKSMGLTQEQFSTLMGIKLATLRNWEQKRRYPESSARLLLRIAAKHPEIVMSVVRDSVTQVDGPSPRKPTQR
jgi:putative transcriptional regulator